MGLTRGSAGLAAVLAAVTLLAGCSGTGEPRLLNLKSSKQGPDEFLVLPTKPLEAPTDFKSLPAPTPGGSNLADQVPAEAVATALGGRASAVQARGVPSADATLIAQAGRNGIDPSIRTDLAAEDLAFRQRNHGRPLERLFSVNVYYRAYKRMSLDQYKELERLRALGLRTSQVPPKPRRK